MIEKSNKGLSIIAEVSKLVSPISVQRRRNFVKEKEIVYIVLLSGLR